MHKRGHGIKLLCKIAGISRATFYYQKDNTRKSDKDLETLEMIKKLPEKQLRYAGAKAKSHYLKLQFGVKMNHKRILRVSNIYGIHVENRVRRFPKGYYQTLRENEANLPKNILNRDFSADKPLQKLVTDISYFKIKSGWLYLSAVMDLFNNEIVTFRMSRHADSNLAVDTINSLCDRYNISNTLIHSDQGSTYKASEYRKLLKEKGFIQSMSRTGNCWDNACMEHFFGTLKAESGYYDVNRHGLLSYQMMEELITDFIQFYNKDRIQKKLGWKSPMTFSLKCA